MKKLLIVLFFFVISSANATRFISYTGNITRIIIEGNIKEFGEIAYVVIEGAVNPDCGNYILVDGTKELVFGIYVENPKTVLPNVNQAKLLVAGLLASKLNGTPVTIVTHATVVPGNICKVTQVYF